MKPLPRKPEGYRVVVTGSRMGRDRDLVYQALDDVHADYGIGLLIHGAAPGYDTLARDWAIDRGVPYQDVPADWDNIDAPGAAIRYHDDGRPYNANAGRARNQRMIDEFKPEFAVAFPGQSGTRDMIRRLRVVAKIRVRCVGW